MNISTRSKRNNKCSVRIDSGISSFRYSNSLPYFHFYGLYSVLVIYSSLPQGLPSILVCCDAHSVNRVGSISVVYINARVFRVCRICSVMARASIPSWLGLIVYFCVFCRKNYWYVSMNFNAFFSTRLFSHYDTSTKRSRSFIVIWLQITSCWAKMTKSPLVSQF